MPNARAPRLQLTPEQDLALGEVFRSFPLDDLHPELRQLWVRVRLGPGLDEGFGGTAFLARLREIARYDERARKRDRKRDKNNLSTPDLRAERQQRDTALGRLVDTLNRAGAPLNEGRKTELGAYATAAIAFGVGPSVAKRAHDSFRRLFLPAFNYATEPPEYIGNGKRRVKRTGKK